MSAIETISMLPMLMSVKNLNYEFACDLKGLPLLSLRRETRCLSFARRCLKTDEIAKHFPLTPDLPNIELRDREKFQVNKAKEEKYFKSTIPYCQRILNQASQGTKKPASTSEENWKLWMAGLQDRLRSRREHRAREGGEEDREGGGCLRRPLRG